MRRVVALFLFAIVAGSAPAQELIEPGSKLADCQPTVAPEGDYGWELHVDYLYWFLNRLRVPPLVAVGPAGSSGRPGDPGVDVLNDDRLTSRHTRYVGVRPEVDWWADSEHNIGFQAAAFFLERDSTYLTIPWNSFPTLAIPYIDARNGSVQARIVAGHDPNVGDLSGSTVLYSRMEFFGQEANALFRCLGGDDFDLHWLAGGRFLQLRERLDLTSSSKILPAESTVIGLEDHFSTFNKFYGGQFGLTGEYRCGRLFVDGKAAVALGVSDQMVRLKGNSTFHVPGDLQAQQYGLLVLPSNSGEYERCVFDVVTELQINVGIEVTSWLRIHVGYSLITWQGTARPGDQIEPVNLSQVRPGLTGPAQPMMPWREDLFWAHGVNVGIECRW
jgi:hypothetical protein